MSNLFKGSLKFLTLKVEDKHSPIEYELPMQMKDDELKGKYSVLAYEKFEREER